MHESPKKQEILIVEDNDDDFEAMERALSRSSAASHPIRRCRDGLDAWLYLKREGKYADLEALDLPVLVLLDLNMPGLDGRRVLSRIRSDDYLCCIPVVVMTTSKAQKDINACYRDGANSFITKPLSWPEFCEAVSRMCNYWFHVTVLPNTRA